MMYHFSLMSTNALLKVITKRMHFDSYHIIGVVRWMTRITITIYSPSPHKDSNLGVILLHEPLQTPTTTLAIATLRKARWITLHLVPNLSRACMNMCHFHYHAKNTIN